MTGGEVEENVVVVVGEVRKLEEEGRLSWRRGGRRRGVLVGRVEERVS